MTPAQLMSLCDVHQPSGKPAKEMGTGADLLAMAG